MALSGSNSKNFSTKSYFRLRVVWSASQNIPNNSSYVTATLYLDSLSGYAAINDATNSTTSITINGNKKSWTTQSDVSANGTKNLGSHAVSVGHNADGTKTFSISASHNVDITWSGSYIGTVTVSGSHTLNTIPRASKFTRLDAFSVGGHPTITISRYSSSFSHDITAKIGSSTIQTWTGQGLPTSLAFSSTADNLLYSAIRNSASATMTVTIQTKSGSTNIGSAVSRTCTVTVPSSVVPSFSSITASEQVASVPGIVGSGRYVQNLSKLKFAINSASGSHYSTIKSYKITFNGQTWNSSTGTTGLINKSGNITATATITDSRSRSVSKSMTVTLLPYGTPTLSKVSAERAIAGGVVNGQGTYVKATTVGSVSSLSVSGVQKNKRVLTINTRVKGTSAWTQKYTNTSTTAYSFSLANTVGTFSATTSYDVQIVLSDYFNTTVSSLTISTASATMSWGKDGVGIGKIHEKGALDVRGDTFIEGTFSLTGQIKAANNQYINSSLGAALNLQNSDVEGLNGLYFNDVSSTGNGEGLNFLKNGKTDQSKNKDDYDNLLMNNGKAYFNGVASGDVLWTGAVYMHADHHITPSKKLSECPNGWLLTWSVYTGGAAKDYDWNHTFVHKTHGERHAGNGFMANVTQDGKNDNHFNKYLYVYNHVINGYASNSISPANILVMREVIAW